MSALNDLTTSEVRFRERIRGYDYDEVDKYVKAVNSAAVHAQDRIAELEERLSLFQSRESSESRGDESESETRDTLVRTLVLAQRTADAAVADARSEAKAITDTARERADKTVSEAEAAAGSKLRSAQERAAHILAEGEENCRLIIAETKRTAAAEMASERERALEEIRALEAFKAEMETTTASIQARLDGLRMQLRSLLTSFGSFVGEIDPEPLVDGSGRQPAIPALEESMTELLGGADPEPDNEPEAAAAEAVGLAEPEAGPEAEDSVEETGEALAMSEPEPRPESTPEFLIDPDDVGQPADETLASLAATDSVPEVPVVRWLDEDDHGQLGEFDEEVLFKDSAESAAELSPDRNGSLDPEPTGRHTVALASAVTDPGVSAGPDTPELFDVDADEDDEFIEQLRRVVSSDAPLPATDAAMAAFFDHDENAGRGGWLGPRT